LIDDPKRSRFELWSRRGFLRGISAVLAWREISSVIPAARWMPAGLTPLAFAETAPDSVLATKPGLRLLNDRPLNAETPAHLLDDDVTPTARLFVRNNGVPPAHVDAKNWRLTVSGEAVPRPVSFSLADLQARFEHHTYQVQIECGGNGRAEFRPRVPGNQWTTGGVGCPLWTGVRIRDVLAACGVDGSAVYVAYRGADGHLSGDPDKRPISRGVPLAKVMEDESLIAWAMNGAPLTPLHGAPLRMVCGGWPGSVSGKWLTELLVRDRVHDGAKMGGKSYRMPCRPIAPGAAVDDDDMCIIESMPVKSLITSPASGGKVRAGNEFEIRGHAWAGDQAVARVAISADFGATWQPAALDPPPNRLAWQRWHATLALPVPGYYEIWARATDTQQRHQPMLVPGWNPKGYLNNATHRIALLADAAK